MIGIFVGYGNEIGLIKGENGSTYFFQKGDTEYHINDRMEFKEGWGHSASSIKIIFSKTAEIDEIIPTNTIDGHTD